MSTYNGRRGPNVSQFIANLNTIPSPQDMATQPQDGLIESDLALFTNTQFIDWDATNLDTDLVEYDREQEQRARRDNAAAHKNNMKDMDFLNGMCHLNIFFELQASIGRHSRWVYIKQTKRLLWVSLFN